MMNKMFVNLGLVVQNSDNIISYRNTDGID